MSDYMLMHMCMIFHFWDFTFFFKYIFLDFYIDYIKFFSTKIKNFLNNENYDLQVIFNASIFFIIKTYISNHAHMHDLYYKNLYLSNSKSHFC
jgi:hypothetical protein